MDASVPNQKIIWDQALLEKYNYSGPRYTSYPTVVEFHEAYTISDFDMACTRYPERDLSLYIHIPFCHTPCYYCGCNKIVTRHAQKVDEYLDVLEYEIVQRALLLSGRQVKQLHLGGGTPSYLTPKQISLLMALLRQEFDFAPDAEVSIEIDPRQIDLSLISHLHKEGFNRLSIGIQDFNPEVQALVNRVQDETFINALMAEAKRLEFASVNLDLIYGLPKQTVDSFKQTLLKTISLRPNRLSVFNYAHMPQIFAAQRKIKDTDLPNAEEKMAILQMTIEVLTSAGYQFIGMDHFALPDDELAIAQKEHRLHRNFQGYTTLDDCDLIGFGVSSISMVGDTYAQNQKELRLYYQQLDEQRHALWKGLSLDEDDLIRREIIKQLICHFRVDTAAIEKTFGIDFSHYFFTELEDLLPLSHDGLVVVTPDLIRVTPKGRLLIRNICMCFDRYLRKREKERLFSRVI